jgi:two-component system, NarL family, response regulator DevR
VDVEERLSVFITAENRLLREALAGIFHKTTDIRVAGAAPASPSPFREIAAAKPDILLVHPPGPASPEQEYVRELREALPRLKVALFGMEESEEIFIGAVRAGAIGYVLKDASAGDVVAAVRTVGQGEAYCPGRLSLALFRCVAKPTAGTVSFRLRIHLGLTRREQQLIPFIAQGLTNKEIAARLNLAEQTVKNHVHRMLQKSGASGRLEMVERCQGNSAGTLPASR